MIPTLPKRRAACGTCASAPKGVFTIPSWATTSGSRICRQQSVWRKLSECPRSFGKKRWIGEAYRERLQAQAGITLPVEEAWAKQIYWAYGLVLDEGTGWDATAFARRLLEAGIETRPFFLGMHEQPALTNLGLFQAERYPVTERLSRQGLYLPCGLALTGKQVDEVCRAVEMIL